MSNPPAPSEDGKQPVAAGLGQPSNVGSAGRRRLRGVRPPRARRFGCESLEERRLLAAGPWRLPPPVATAARAAALEMMVGKAQEHADRDDLIAPLSVREGGEAGYASAHANGHSIHTAHTARTRPFELAAERAIAANEERSDNPRAFAVVPLRPILFVHVVEFPSLESLLLESRVPLKQAAANAATITVESPRVRAAEAEDLGHRQTTLFPPGTDAVCCGSALETQLTAQMRPTSGKVLVTADSVQPSAAPDTPGLTNAPWSTTDRTASSAPTPLVDRSRPAAPASGRAEFADREGGVVQLTQDLLAPSSRPAEAVHAPAGRSEPAPSSVAREQPITMRDDSSSINLSAPQLGGLAPDRHDFSGAVFYPALVSDDGSGHGAAAGQLLSGWQLSTGGIRSLENSEWAAADPAWDVGPAGVELAADATLGWLANDVPGATAAHGDFDVAHAEWTEWFALPYERAAADGLWPLLLDPSCGEIGDGVDAGLVGAPGESSAWMDSPADPAPTVEGGLVDLVFDAYQDRETKALAEPVALVPLEAQPVELAGTVGVYRELQLARSSATVDSPSSAPRSWLGRTALRPSGLMAGSAAVSDGSQLEEGAVSDDSNAGFSRWLGRFGMATLPAAMMVISRWRGARRKTDRLADNSEADSPRHKVADRRRTSPRNPQ